MRQAAQQSWTVYNAYRAVGFNEEQSFALLMFVLSYSHLRIE